MTQLAELARASQEVADTSSRSAKIKRLAACLEAVDRDDVDCVVAWLSGELLQRRTGVGYAALAELAPPASTTSLTVTEVNRVFAELCDTAGPGSQSRRAALLDGLFGASTPSEQSFLRKLMGGELRQGALAGIMTDAIAQAAHIPVAEVRRAAMLQGDLPAVAKLAIGGGKEALSRVHLEVGRGIHPMLAQSATSIDDALGRIEGEVAFEAKLDGARIQVHVKDGEVRCFTRSLDDITSRLTSLLPSILDWPVKSVVADGEIMSLGADEKPRPFQETASDVARHDARDRNEETRRLGIFLFDLLHLDGVDLIDQPAEARRLALENVVPPRDRVERIVTRDAEVARAFYQRVVKAGYEGVIAKSLTAPYEAGRRGAGWLKVKPVHTLDLVVLAVEWGSGRRTGKLSNIHLGARDPRGGFVMLGKTFKGMTDAMLAWQTERFLELADGPTDKYVVKVRPEQVVEIAFDGIQTSSRYPAKMALRFARVLRYRDDKSAAEADTVDTVRAFAQRE